MELFTRTQFATLLENGQKYNDDPDFNPKPVVKLFNPVGAATWLIASVDPDYPDHAFGLCDLGMQCPELGSVSVEELTAYSGPLSLGIERDIHFEADKTLSEYADEARKNHRIMA